jgi:hypothetical protein
VSKTIRDMVFHRRATAFSAWNAVCGLFLSNSTQRAVYALQDFHSLQQGDLSVHDYCCRIKRLADTLTDVGHPITDQDLVVNTMRDVSTKFTNALGVINAMNPLPSFLWVHSYLLQEETRLDRSHKIEAANTLLATGATAGTTSSSAAAALVANTSSTGASKTPTTPLGSSPTKGGDRKKKNKSKPMPSPATILHMLRQIRPRRHNNGERFLPGLAWSRRGSSLHRIGVLRLAASSPTSPLRLRPWSRRRRFISPRCTPLVRRPTSTPRSMGSRLPPLLTPATANGFSTPASLPT